ncbi:tol-pal system-associated acyl-CoA thioesterase [Kordiimonas sediminis]|uniref:Tol-pal system-associated acyl-CoA thioesterase n=1 Tax=Kordiimonas sediminis TaxID=1735581 RepID=A0A919ASY3_9PROT|nr:thioesterase family protein [Kordiimonas sediminis]GHF22457.1 tol-pal system-associated acyl-CoA thioesterase [Kordiimonas sediminis]
MTSLSEGQWIDGVFHFPIRVYYEDTDVGGMVYHGRYVSYFERVRTESIRGTAADVNHLFDLSEEEGGPLTYVVSKINITYKRQAKIGDILMGQSMVTKVRAAGIEVKQWISRGDEVIAEAEVLAAVIGEDGRPRRWTPDARACWQQWLEEADAANTLGRRE